MTVQRADKAFFFTKDNCIDKTYELEKGIKMFPSIFIEGAAASGKTVAVKMFLEKQKDINFALFFMNKERDDGTFIRKLSQIRKRMEQETIWVICEDMNQPLSEIKATTLVDFVQRLQDKNRCIFVSREKPHRKFLELLWKEKMYMVTQKDLLFSINEIEQMRAEKQISVRAKEIYQETGGWPGCVSLMMRILERREETGEKISVAEVRECYEIAEYIESDILGTLSKLEKDILEIGAWCPWLSKKMCMDIWNVSGSEEVIENLVRKGFLTEIEKGRYNTARLFEKTVRRQIPEKHFWIMVGQWYETEDFIKEAFFCIKQSGDQKFFQEFAIRSYKKLPYISMGTDDFEEWKENLPELCFLRGMQCCFRQDIDGMDREIRRLEKQLDQTNDLKVKEIYLNLLYARPNFPLDLWLKLLEKNEKTDVSISLYNILGGSDSYLCGLRDLSELFSCPRKEENNKMRIWKESLDEQAMEWYRRARKEYYIEINQEKCETFEKCEVSQVLRDSEEELALDVNEQNYGRFLQYGKAYLKMRQYEKAENIFEKLIPFLKLYHRNRFLAEVLFEQAVCTWEKGSHGQALRYVIESFLYSENARYVLFYTEYGKGGKEVLSAYVEWMKQNSPEGWHRKKKYNYGNVRRMPKEDYLELILRMAKKQCSSAPESVQKTPKEHLTMMETVILTLIGKGRSNVEICEELNLKLSTVKSHIYSLYRKLGVKNRMQATIKGKEMGILK